MMKDPVKKRSLLPKGVVTFLPEGAARRRSLEATLLSLFRQWGYEEIITPIFEYLDVFSLGVGEELLDRAFKFVDRGSGRLMVLRPDVTPQIARMTATVLSHFPLPLRLCYSANVFRHEEEHAGRERESYQIGAECIGLAGVDADVEMIVLLIEALRSLGLDSFRIAIGHMGFFCGLLEGMKEEAGVTKGILHAVARKDQAALNGWLARSGLPARQRRMLSRLPELFGGEEVLQEARSMGTPPSCRKALQDLQHVLEVAKQSGLSDHLLVDLGEVRKFEYYTGVVFEIFVEGMGQEIGGGGRYDRLLQRYGRTLPSTGFALHIERLQACLDKNGTAGDYLAADLEMIYPPGRFSDAFELALRLRREGWRVLCHMEKGGGSTDPSARRPVRHRLKLQGQGRGRTLSWTDLRNGTHRQVGVEQFITFLHRADRAQKTPKDVS